MMNPVMTRPVERLRHYVEDGNQVVKVVGRQETPEIVCWQCWYGECDECLKGKQTVGAHQYAETYSHPCECVHWWSALEVGANYAEIIEAEKVAHEATANLVRNARNGLRTVRK